MKVSVIIPLHNLAAYVGETIDSILAQTFQDFEIVIIDDASTDSSRQVAKEYLLRDPRIKLICQDVNIGLPAARNLAIRNSSGEFVLPLDADDKIDPQYLEKTLPLMAEPNVGVVSTWMTIFGARPEQTGSPESCYPIFFATREQILNGNCQPVCSLIRRTCLDDVGLYPEEMREGSEDWALWVKIILTGRWKVEILPEYLFYYRTRRDSMSRQSTMMPFEQAKAKIRRLYGS